MTYKQLMAIIRDSRLSPEVFGEQLGISGMTLRRWRDLPPDDKLPDLYKDAVVRVAHKLVKEGRLSIESKHLRDLMTQEWLPFETAASGLGMSIGELDSLKQNPDGALETLSQIGGSAKNREIVDASKNKIKLFKKMGEDWKYRITKLLLVVQSKRLSAMEKLVAYGAFFYLLNPFDFIPDAIPIFGFLDDLFFLSIALSFYLKRYPEFFTKKDEK